MKILTFSILLVGLFFVPVGSSHALEYSPPVVIPNPHDLIDVHFGQSISAVGNKIVVGNPDSNLAGANTGTIFVYSEHFVNLLTTIPNPEKNSKTEFGAALAELDRKRVVIGAPGSQMEPSTPLDRDFGVPGAVFVFNVDTGQQILKIPNPSQANGERFGASIDVSEDQKIIVGAPQTLLSPGLDSGAVHVFDFNGELLQSFTPPEPKPGDEFGAKVLGFGDKVLISNPAGSTDKTQTGIVYLYEVNSRELIKKFQQENSQSFSRFGESMSVDDDKILIGAPQTNGEFPQEGSVYLYDGNSGSLISKLNNPDPVPFGNFGYSVKLTENYIVVGAPSNLGTYDVISEENPEIVSEPDVGVEVNPNSGIVYVFDRDSLDLLVTLENPSPENNEFFGKTLETIGSNIIVGTPHDNLGLSKTGSISVFFSDEESQYVYSLVKGTESFKIPQWLKTTAHWWSQGDVPDSEFLDACQFLIVQGLIVVDDVEFNENAPRGIQDWVKDRAEWWYEGQISDLEFLNGIEFLIENGMLRT